MRRLASNIHMMAGDIGTIPFGLEPLTLHNVVICSPAAAVKTSILEGFPNLGQLKWW
jgi:hypothetical protein